MTQGKGTHSSSIRSRIVHYYTCFHGSSCSFNPIGVILKEPRGRKEKGKHIDCS